MGGDLNSRSSDLLTLSLVGFLRLAKKKVGLANTVAIMLSIFQIGKGDKMHPIILI